MTDDRIDKVKTVTRLGTKLEGRQQKRRGNHEEGGQSVPEMCFKEVHNGGSGKTRLPFFDYVGVID
jgi:hypothetical protein